MTELENIFITSAVTLLGGVILLVIGQLATEVLINPVLRFRSIRQEISMTLIFRKNILVSLPFKENPDLLKAVSVEIRKLAADLRAKFSDVLLLWIWVQFGLAQPKRDVSEAAALLIRISNFAGDERKFNLLSDDIAKVGELLRVDVG